MPELPIDQVLTAFLTYRNELDNRREHVHAQVQNQQPLPDHVAAMFDYSLAMIEAELSWLDILIQKLENTNA